MPEMAKKIAKFMAEFRGTANEFKETWRREVDLENAAKEFDLSNIEAEVNAETPRPASTPPPVAEIREVDPEQLENLKRSAQKQADAEAKAGAAANDKK